MVDFQKNGRIAEYEFDAIEPRHLQSAEVALQRNGRPEGYKESTDFLAVSADGTEYEPKPLFGIAATEALGFPVEGRHFTGGIGTKCFRILEQNGFKIVTKASADRERSRVETPTNKWIFQCNPDRFDVDGLFESGETELLYLANQSAKKMQPGDTVFLWRSKGRNNDQTKRPAGIIAKGYILEGVQILIDSQEKSKWWIEPDKALAPAPRVKLRFTEVANKKEMIQRDWLLDDPVLHDLTILKMANGTNYLLPERHSQRLEHLWSRTGETWTRAESLAALRVYHQTYKSPVSKKRSSPVGETATLIGRPVTGVYNKVMNFRSIDPRDQRAGLSGAGAGDREVWEEFFDAPTGEIDSQKLEINFERLWLHEPVVQSESETEGKEYKQANTSPAKYRPGPTQGDREYSVSSKQHSSYYVYVLELSNKKAVKVGYSHDPKDRLRSYNKGMAEEVTGLKWSLTFTQKLETATEAEALEQTVLSAFSDHKLPSNGEILKDIGSDEVILTIARNISLMQKS